MTENGFFAAFFFPSFAAVLIYFMKYRAAVLQARVGAGQNEAYRAIAAKAAGGQAETAAAIASLGEVLGDIQSRLGAIEKVLKEVE